MIAVGVAALALFAWNRYPALTGALSGPAGEPTAMTRNQVYFGPANSIAVLPFQNGTASQDQAFWSIGFTRELHRLITRAPGLQVTSHNSSFFFQDPSVPLPVVGERLQSRYLLTGEFLQDQGRVKAEAHLYDAREEKELWSLVLDRDRDLAEVYSIQDEILAGVMAAIRPGWSGSLPKAEPRDSRAWEFYLQGQFMREKRTPDGYRGAEEAFRSALETSPGYELPRVGLAGVWLATGAAGDEGTLRVEEAREALTEALDSRPDLPEALVLLSHIRHRYDWDWQGALEAAKQGLSISPGDPELMSMASLALFSLGRFDTAGEYLAASVRQDPLNLSRRLRLGLLQEFSGQYEEALSSYRQVLGLNPEFPGAKAYRARVKIIQEKPDSAMRESELEVDPFWKRYSRILALVALQRDDEAEPLLALMIEEDGHHAAYQVTEILAFKGDLDTAFEWLQKAYDQKDGGMSEVLGNFFLQNLHGDPRWSEMLSRLSLPLDFDDLSD